MPISDLSENPKSFKLPFFPRDTRVSLCQPDFAVISILYSMPISDFSVPISINRFALAASFYTGHHVLVQWQGLENNFRSSLSRLSEILSNILNILHLGLKLNHVVKHLFKAAFNIQSEHDVKYLQHFLSDVFHQWRFFHPSQEEVSTDSFSDSSPSPSILD